VVLGVHPPGQFGRAGVQVHGHVRDRDVPGERRESRFPEIWCEGAGR
jgi:hypothetical protein